MQNDLIMADSPQLASDVEKRFDEEFFAESPTAKLTQAGKQFIATELERQRQEIAQECYLQCLAVECGEGECARAIRTKFNLKGR